MFLICIRFSCFSWFAGAMTRDDADEALKDEKDNTYLVRYIVVILLTLIYPFKYNNRNNP